MKPTSGFSLAVRICSALAVALFATAAHADVIMDWNAKADALEDALVALDEIRPLLPESRQAEARAFEATLRSLISDCREAAEDRTP